MSIILRKRGEERARVYWTGKRWDDDASKAHRYDTREAALKVHAKLLESEAWPAGENPIVVDGAG